MYKPFYLQLSTIAGFFYFYKEQLWINAKILVIREYFKQDLLPHETWHAKMITLFVDKPVSLGPDALFFQHVWDLCRLATQQSSDKRQSKQKGSPLQCLC